jgi:tRNA G18 (ribose-2'-O)-methylase SpoU
MTVDDFRGVSDAALMRDRGLFVAEGRIVVRRVIDDPRFHVESILVNEASRRDLADALDRLAAGVPVHVRGTAEFETITGYNLHRGCLALVHRPPPTPIEAVLSSDRAIVILEDVADADNIGGVFRNAAAFGAGGIILSPSACDPLYRKAIRTSMAATLTVPFARTADWPAALSRVRAAGFTLVALTPREPSEPLDAFAARRPRDRKIALIVGTEGAGLSADVERQSDARVRIPISACVDSLNLSVAVGIAMYELTR